MATFTLNVSTLSGFEFNYVDNIIEDRGRSIQLAWSQGGANQDMELLGYSIRVFPAETESKVAS